VDNCRDLGNKVANITFKAGKSSEELTVIKQIDVESRFAGWISCFLPDSRYSNQNKLVRIELKGPDNTLRLRQVKVLGHFNSSQQQAMYEHQERQVFSPSTGKPIQQNFSPAFSGIKTRDDGSNGKVELCSIQQRNCEAETLRVFRLITGQVFGRLLEENMDIIDGHLPKNVIYNDPAPLQISELEAPTNQNKTTDSQHGSGSDLKEHVVGILFSRQKLTHLQKQICAHIVRAIRKEATRIREEWESSLCSASLPGESKVTKQGTSTDPGLSGNTIAPPLIVLDHEGPASSPDTYCFEMLSLVLALSGSSVGRSYIASQLGLVKDLLALLHTGTARIQRQVIGLLRRVLPEISPTSFGSILGIADLPPKDFSSLLMSSSQSALQSGNLPPSQDDTNGAENTFDMHKPGIIDVFLSCIAKALTLQVKVKGSVNTKESSISTLKNAGIGRQNIASCSLATAIHPRDPTGPRWWARGTLPKKIAEEIVCLLKDMTAGKLSEEWASMTKSAIAENILNLTHLDEKHRDSGECLRYPVVWLALASLCVLDKDHVEALSSGDWSAAGAAVEGGLIPPRPTCDNHDDNETLAVVVCDSCGNLCLDCDRFLHLHRKTKSHARQVFKEEEEAIKVDLHEGCGRAKLFWIMALADSLTLKAMVEFREGSNRSGKLAGLGGSGVIGTLGNNLCFSTCRFCGRQSSAEMPVLDSVCSDSDCIAFSHAACSKVLPCGHFCGGIVDEVECLPCLNGCSSTIMSTAVSRSVAELRQDADDMCMICFTDALSPIPSIQLNCGHVFHHHCCLAVLDKRWVGPRITFGFKNCPICKTKIEHVSLKWLLDPIEGLYEDVKKKSLMRLEYEGLSKCEAVTTKGARFYNDLTGFAIDRYAYYVCFKCGKAYYGGEAQCDADAGLGDTYNPEELVCGGCSDVSRAQMCPKHGTDYLEYKCRYCCSVAVFFCFGTTHFCNACHDDFQVRTYLLTCN
jgi:E3 ubiquitin-protein ligase MYCBP2